LQNMGEGREKRAGEYFRMMEKRRMGRAGERKIWIGDLAMG
jgi:hypothetical protein